MSNRTKNDWGRSLWEFLHTITIVDYQNNEMFNKNVLKNLMVVADIIPCRHCAEHYNKFLERLDSVDLTKSMVLFYWTVDLHNDVNKRLGKNTWTYEQAINNWCKKV